MSDPDPTHRLAPGVSVPRWARAVLATHRALDRLHDQRASATLELLRSGLPASARGPFTDAVFARQPTYSPGGARFSEALFDWELAALQHPAWPRSGRVLLGGAGGGRELSALSALGYEVEAFEPSALADDLARVALSAPTACTALRGDYDALVRALTGGDGPLRPLAPPTRFDAVALGWGSLSHLLDPSEHRALLRALRRAWPSAPVLLSVHRLPSAPSLPRAARAVRRLAEGLGWPGAALSDAVDLQPFAGFIYRFSERELGELAEGAGYVATIRARPYLHGVLVPAG
ncbi:MAG: methyltransferase domain-containing protein [Myxococcaceae bacterium]|nr:MAG: methyltransferase domain-containing protein [Myxococcaceae bacterium]